MEQWPVSINPECEEPRPSPCNRFLSGGSSQDSGISVIIPAHNGAAYLVDCLGSLSRCGIAFECIVVDDGSKDDTVAIARAAGANVLSTGSRRGPAFARNLGAAVAHGEILLFLDADVCVHADNLDRVASAFQEDPSLDALIGSYDDSPGATDFLSQYRNLMHYFTHQNSRRNACTFWTGFGAIRKRVLLDHMGFDCNIDRPTMEDIELGYRLHGAGRKIVLDRSLQVKHLKPWTFFAMMRTDVIDRGIPWTQLILRHSLFPNDLNLRTSQRISVALTYALLVITAAACIQDPAGFFAPLFALLFLFIADYEVDLRFRRNRFAFAATAVLLGVVGVSSYWDNRPLILGCSVMAYLLLFWHRQYFREGDFWSRLCSVYLVASILFVGVQLPRQPISAVLVVLFGCLMAINFSFYRLLTAKRGVKFALAAVPFHLLYFLYCGLAFAIGLGRHMRLKLRHTPAS